MTLAQKQAHSKDRISQRDKVKAVLIAKGPSTPKQLAEILGLPPGRITARLNDLLKIGEAYVSAEQSDATYYAAETNEANYERRAKSFQKAKDLKAFVYSVKCLKPHLPKETIEHLRRVYGRLRAS